MAFLLLPELIRCFALPCIPLTACVPQDIKVAVLSIISRTETNSAHIDTSKIITAKTRRFQPRKILLVIMILPSTAKKINKLGGCLATMGLIVETHPAAHDDIDHCQIFEKVERVTQNVL